MAGPDGQDPTAAGSQHRPGTTLHAADDTPRDTDRRGPVAMMMVRETACERQAFGVLIAKIRAAAQAGARDDVALHAASRRLRPPAATRRSWRSTHHAPGPAVGAAHIMRSARQPTPVHRALSPATHTRTSCAQPGSRRPPRRCRWPRSDRHGPRPSTSAQVDQRTCASPCPTFLPAPIIYIT